MRSAAPGMDYEVIVIGGGVNGLVCATLLALAKRRVLLVEARDRMGGMCATGEITPGYRVSTIAHLIGPLDAEVTKALRLNKFGLQLSAKQISAVALSAQGQHIVLGEDLRNTSQSLMSHSSADAKAWAPFETKLRRAAQQVHAWVKSPPGGAFDVSTKSSFFSGRSAARASVALDPEWASIADGSIADLLDGEFSTPLLKGALAFDAVMGNALSPSMLGTAFLAVMRRALDGANSGGLVHPQGGVGGFVSALVKAAEAAGVKFKLNARVDHFLFDSGRLAGVEFTNSEAVYAPQIVSSLSPQTTLLGFGAERDLPIGLKRRLASARISGCVSKVNLALSSQPSFKGLDKKYLKDRLIICPSVDHLERSFAAYEQGRFSSEVSMEITVPSSHDATLVKSGQHVLSATVFYVPKNLASGSWETAKAELVSIVGARLREYAPELPDQVIGADVYTPADIDELSGGAGGHWHGGDLSFDQLGILRPAEGVSRSATPVPGLFLCGAGTHPCGGVTGINGRIAAEAVLAHLTVAP